MPSRGDTRSSKGSTTTASTSYSLRLSDESGLTKGLDESGDILGEEAGSFVKTLREAGIVLYKANCKRVHRLLDDKDSQDVVRALYKHFQADLLHPKKANEFLTAVKEYLESDNDNANLKKALNPTEKSSSIYGDLLQESLIRILIQVEDIQTDLICWLLEKLAIIAMEEEEEPQSARGKTNQQIKLSQSILCQLRFLNTTVNGEKVSDKIVEILEVAPVELQREIITALPDFVEEGYHTKLAMVLRDLMKNNSDLTSPILHAFTFLSIKSDVMAEVRQSIIKTVSATQAEDLPVVVQFILEGTEKGDECETVFELRDQINFANASLMSQMSQRRLNSKRIRTQSATNSQDVDVMVLHIIKTAFFANRNLGDAWIKVIDQARIDPKPLDILVLLILFTMVKRKRVVQALIKNKIRSNFFTEDLMKDTFRQHSGVLKNYVDAFTEIYDTLSQSTEAILTNMAVVIYRECFLHLGTYSGHTIIADLIAKIGSTAAIGSAQTSKVTSLRTLDHLAEFHTLELQRYAFIIEGILDRTSSLSLSEYRQVMDVLFRIAYVNSESQSNLKNNLHIIVMKQIQSMNNRLVRMGVTGAVMAVKNMSTPAAEVNLDFNDTDSSMTSSATQRPEKIELKRAKKLLETVKAKSKILSEVGGLFMDELSNVIRKENVDNNLVKWIEKSLVTDFTDDYVIDVNENGDIGISDENGGFTKVNTDNDFVPSSARFCCDTAISDADICLNLTPIVTKSFGISNDGLGTKCSLAARMIPEFRLLQFCVTKSHERDLEEIDALLFCPILMPSQDTLDKIECLNNQERNVVCSTLFYCANWFRELLNAFAGSKDADYRKKVILRLRDLIKINKDISSCLRFHPRFHPPNFIHLEDVSSWQPPNSNSATFGKARGGKGKGKGRKRKASLTKDDAQNITISGNNQTQFVNPTQADETLDKSKIDDISSVNRPFVNIDAYSPFFRELDLCVFDILSFDVIWLRDNDDDKDDDAQDEPRINPPELAFLLEDLNAKIRNKLTSSNASKKGSFPGKGTSLKHIGFSNLEQVSEESFASFVVGLLDYLLANLDEITCCVKKWVALHGGMDSEEFLNKITIDINICIEYLLKVFISLFSWSGFHSKEAKKTMRLALQKIASRKQTTISKDLMVKDYARVCFQYMMEMSDCLVSAGIAAGHLQLLKIFVDLSESQDLNKKLADIAEACLKRNWITFSGEKDKGAKFNAHVESMLRTYFESNSDLRSSLSMYLNEEMTSIVASKGKDTSSESIPTLNKLTLQMHYRILFEYLINYVRDIGSCNAHVPFDILREKLNSWDFAIECLTKLVEVMKTQKSRVFIGPLLKFARLFLDQFLKQGMTIIDHLFKEDKIDCVSVIKKLQSNTKYLQNVCLHSKDKKDVSLSKFVPPLKKSLEALIYRVKDMLAKNDAIDAFWLGNLRNRNLAGEVIMSQSEADEEEADGDANEEDEDDALEDDQSDVEISDKEEQDDEIVANSQAEPNVSLSF